MQVGMPITQADLAAALPDLTSTIRAKGLQQDVEVARDQWGIPHIRAASAHDAFFAQGFVTAQDRLWHMDHDRHRALGRWSEFAGASGVEADRLMRAFDLERAAKADLAVSSDVAKAMLDAYSAGVNAFIRTTESYPVEYRMLGMVPEAWQPWHCLAVYKVRNMLMGTFEIKLWRARLARVLGAGRAEALFRGYPDESLVSVPPGETYGPVELDGLDAFATAMEWPGEPDGGSNAWVLSGPRTASGLPLVAGDSHRPLDTPNVYYQVHITCPAFRCSGYALPGVPGMPHFSHTEHVAWGMTHGQADYQDLYIERFRTESGRLEYAWLDTWLPAEVRTEELAIRDGPSEMLAVVRTRHGPIVAGDPRAGYGIAFSHPGTNRGTPWANTLHDLLVAGSADDAEEALRVWTEPVNNFVYADVHGEFGYRYRGRIPIRSMANAWVPVPGWTGEHEWRGRIPFEELPSARNPQAGFVVTCNNAPTTADYPHYINTLFAPDWRAQRVTARLSEITPAAATAKDMESIHADRQSIPAGIFTRRLAAMDLRDPDARDARDILVDWDCRMDRSSSAAVIYGVARTYLFREIVTAALGPLANAALGAPSGIGRGAATHTAALFARAVTSMAEDDDSCLETGRTWAECIESALAQAVRELRSRLGDDMRDWKWGSMHHTRPRHPLSEVFPDCAKFLDPPPVETHGDGDTPLAGAYSISDRCVATLMSVNRYVHDPSDWRNSRWIVPLGASGHPGSPHYADQARLWADIETIPQLWDWNDIADAAETRQKLVPEKPLGNE